MNKTSSSARHSAAHDINIEILSELDTHLDAIEALHARAFGPGRFARAAFRVREQGDYDRSLSFVAMMDDRLVGSVRLTWIETSVSKSLGLLLGPLAVESDVRNKGIGRILVAQCIAAAQKTDAQFLMLVGDQPYYGHQGFHVAPFGKVHMPAPVNRSRLLIHPLGDFDMTATEGLVRHVDLTH